MAVATHWLDYEIHLAEKWQIGAVQAAQSQWNHPRNDIDGALVGLFDGGGLPLGGNGYVYASPERAAAEYGAVIVRQGEQRPAVPPFITSPWLYPVASPDRLPPNLDFFTRARGGWLGLGSTFPTADRYTWRGRFVYTPSNTPMEGDDVVATPDTIRQRYWIDGFEWPVEGENPTAGSTMNNFITRAASRHEDGYGLAVGDNTITTVREHTWANKARGWERFYMRPVMFPRVGTDGHEFWRLVDFATGATGLALKLLPNGELLLSRVTAASVRQMLSASSRLTLDAWHRIDILTNITGVRVFINGALAMSEDNTGQSGTLQNSRIGNTAASATLGGSLIYFDDWMAADTPAALAANIMADLTQAGLDWRNGSRMVRVDPSAFGAAHDSGTWGTTVERLLGNPTAEQISSLDFSTASAAQPLFETAQNVLTRVNADRLAINGGIVAMTAGLYNSIAAGGANGTFGYSLSGAAYVTATVAQNAVLHWNHVSYFPSGLTAPVRLTSLGLRYTPGASAHARVVRAMGAVCEVLGVYGAEDMRPEDGIDVLPSGPPVGAMLQNAAVAGRSPWAASASPPQSPVIAQSGTYVGNGTQTRLLFRVPPTFIWIRRVTATERSGLKWWPTMLAANGGFTAGPSPEQGTRVAYNMVTPDPGSGQNLQEAKAELIIAGNDADSNENTVTYQYVAFCDPGGRLALAGVFDSWRAASVAVDPTLLWKPAFTPTGVFFQTVELGGGTGVTAYYKGPGHATASASRLDAAETATILTLGLGSLTIGSNFPTGATLHEANFLALRGNDGSGDPALASAIQLGSYVGNGSSPRVISFTATGLRPLFVLVVPHNAASIFRDPSHTGTVSSEIAAAGALTSIAANGIQAGGIDGMMVSTALNANGVTYDYFAIMGGATAGNNGWAANGEFPYLEPIDPADWPFGTDDLDSGDDGAPAPVVTVTTPIDPPGDDLGTDCLSFSTELCNLALSHIGVSDNIQNMLTDQTPEAAMARLHYPPAVLEVLRKHPWPFATRYATLDKLDGTQADPAVPDWFYSFRWPEDCVFVRRIVRKEAKRGPDRFPPPFRAGTDTLGRLIYTDYRNAESTDDDATITVEYTHRPDCAAQYGESLFRLALSWFMAAKLAPSCARNKMTAADCYGMFERTIKEAQTVNAREEQKEDDPGPSDWHRDRFGDSHEDLERE